MDYKTMWEQARAERDAARNELVAAEQERDEARRDVEATKAMIRTSLFPVMGECPDILHCIMWAGETITAARRWAAAWKRAASRLRYYNERTRLYLEPLTNKWRSAVGLPIAKADTGLLPLWAVGRLDEEEERADAAERELARVRGLLAGWIDWYENGSLDDGPSYKLVQDTRALAAAQPAADADVV